MIVEHLEAGQISARFNASVGADKDTNFSLNVDFSMPAKGIIALFGHSGSGKTTLLRCIAGLTRVEQGYLEVNGDVWQNENWFLPVHKRPIGYVFQEASLFAHLTAAGNLNYARKRAAKAVSCDFYRRVIDVMGIAPLLPRYPDTLSGGERQRVAIARALLIQPKLLLMDEPLASLDYARKQEILPYLERLHQSFDIPVLYVSHSMDEVARLADHALVLDQGKIIAQGSVGEVFSRIDLPLNFEQNTGAIITGTVVERDEKWHLCRVEFAGGSLWVRDGGDEIGRQLRIRILARDVSLANSVHTDTSILNRVQVSVSEIKTDIDPAFALLRLKLNGHYIIARVTQKSLHHLNIRLGEQVWAQIKSVAIVR